MRDAPQNNTSGGLPPLYRDSGHSKSGGKPPFPTCYSLEIE